MREAPIIVENSHRYYNATWPPASLGYKPLALNLNHPRIVLPVYFANVLFSYINITRVVG